MSTRNPLIKIGDQWLTSDGTEAGHRCKATVENEGAFASSYVGASNVALDLVTVHTQLVERGVSGIEFGFVLEYLRETQIAALLTLLNTSFDEDSTVRVIVESLTDFDVQARPVFQGDQLLTYESRSGGIARNVRLMFISTAPGA